VDRSESGTIRSIPNAWQSSSSSFRERSGWRFTSRARKSASVLLAFRGVGLAFSVPPLHDVQCVRHTVSLGNLAGVTPRLGAAKPLAILRLRAAVENQLTDPDADQQSIAGAAGISGRHANYLLSPAGTSIIRLLMEQRVGACRKAIKDQPHRRISNIACACGFRDPNRFTRAVKSHYRLSPRDDRNS
jgi:AraC-like DNA-binding protein